MSDDETPGENSENGASDDAEVGDPNAQSTVLSDLVSSVVGRLQENLGGDDTSGLQNTIAAVLQNVSEARKRQAKQTAAAATKVPSIDGADEDEDDNVVQLDSVRASKAPRGVDMKALVDSTVRAFAMARVAGEGEAAPDEVTIDGEFVAEHGAELVKAVAGAVSEAWVGALAGVDMSAHAARPEDGLSDPDELEASDEAPPVAVRYDMLSIVASLIRPMLNRPSADRAKAAKPLDAAPPGDSDGGDADTESDGAESDDSEM